MIKFPKVPECIIIFVDLVVFTCWMIVISYLINNKVIAALGLAFSRLLT